MACTVLISPAPLWLYQCKTAQKKKTQQQRKTGWHLQCRGQHRRLGPAGEINTGINANNTLYATETCIFSSTKYCSCSFVPGSSGDWRIPSSWNATHAGPACSRAWWSHKLADKYYHLISLERKADKKSQDLPSKASNFEFRTSAVSNRPSSVEPSNWRSSTLTSAHILDSQILVLQLLWRVQI
jgi:hypothetical protein